MAEVNVPLLRKAVEWVEAEAAKPEVESHWHQGKWRQPQAIRQEWLYLSGFLSRDRAEQAECGTAYCLAGYVCELQGEQWKNVWSDGQLKPGYDGEHRMVADVARAHLGITTKQAVVLFDGSNDAVAIRRRAEAIAGEKL